MPKIKLTETVVDGARPEAKDYEIRDTVTPGFLLKVTPSGRRIFMLAYTAANGQRRKPAIGRYGELTVEQARGIAQDWLADVRRGTDPSADRAAARAAPTIKELCQRFLSDYSLPRNKPSTVRGNRVNINAHIIPKLGHLKVPDVTRSDVARLIAGMERTPPAANHTLACLRRMFGMAEVWGYRPDGTNPTRHIPKYPQKGSTRLITDDELRMLFAYLDRADTEGLEHPFLTLAIRLQFAFAARRSEILDLQWEWVDFANRRVVWPDSKTDGMSTPFSAEAIDLLRSAPRLEGSPYVDVAPSIFDPANPMSGHTYTHGWTRILERAGLQHCGTHAIRHRAATDIANSGVPLKVGMALTAHQTVTMFMRYVHAEDDPIRAAVEVVSAHRRSVVSGTIVLPLPGGAKAAAAPSPESQVSASADAPQGFEERPSDAPAGLRNYRPFRKRSDPNRSAPPNTKSASEEADHV